ncbi:sigma-54-dependent Fis family transcriptional regulator [Desulfatirhabdium butyrativorans]|uniref:sigma-54-dependent Fis family transcriptional regulator n=1 Tax=Desulfatirhabdium butyrativorans TaxID=340467 RepID=UPI0004039546|nr:sigma-54-dependent Fis family transcriptional regulator [Desulfatirhabdium butyrativorans]
MYELVWQGSGYHIVERNSGSVESSSEFRSAALPLSTGSRIDRSHWKRFVQNGSMDTAVVCPPIGTSWLRCREMGVDPAVGKCRNILPEAEFSESHRRLQALSQETKRRLYDLVRDQGLLVTISDPQGILVTMFGDHRTLVIADRLHFGPGADWSEKSVGTNAIGTALAECRSLQVAGFEHFCEGHHEWVCTAAPVFGISGDVVGCVDVSGPKTVDHSRALSLVMIGARAIERELFRQHIGAFGALAEGAIRSRMPEAEMTGIVVLDMQGRIVFVNPAAVELLGRAVMHAAGMSADELFAWGGGSFRRISFREMHRCGSISVTFRPNPAIPVQAFPLVSPNGVFSGMALAIWTRAAASVRRRVSPAALSTDPFQRILGESDPLQQAIATARRIASTAIPVLITGESGVGKEVMARAIHEASPRSRGPFVAVNCGAIPAELIQSELFGYEEGAFTGARRGGASGKFEQASGGTLFLDEIGEMPASMQVNLLRVIEDGQVTRVGGSRPIPVDVRLIAATHQDIDTRMASGAFRRDLYYRIHGVRIEIPPLRKRGGDIVLLARRFIEEMAPKLGRQIRSIDDGFFDALKAYDWPGNVRELRHAVESAIALMQAETLGVDSLPEAIRRNRRTAASAPTSAQSRELNLEVLEKAAIRDAWRSLNGNVTQMARALGIGRNTLYAKMKKYGIA